MIKAKPLPTRTLGNSDLSIAAIGLGAWAIGGGDWEFGWGGQDDRDSIAAIHRALELGVNWIDTAAVYGLGHSEEVVGKALKLWRGPRPYVFTKCGIRWSEAERKTFRRLTRASVREELEMSLHRLQVQTIDLYQIHWPDPEAEIEEAWETLQQFKREGKIRWAGVSNFSVAQMERVKKLGAVTSLQPPYSLIRRDIEPDILPYCERNGIGVLAYAPMASGMLTGKMTRERIAQMPDDDFRKRHRNFQGAALERNLKVADLLREIGDACGKSPGEVAIAWVLRNSAVTAAIVGARNPRQIEGTIGAATWRLPAEDARRLKVFLDGNPA